MQITWKEIKRRHTVGEDMFVGRIKVGSILWAKIRHNETKVYHVVLHLPGINLKEGTDKFETMDEAKRRLEFIVSTWFQMTGTAHST